MDRLKNLWGTVRPYTRHLSRCKHRSKNDHNSCDCPKWLYVNREGEEPRRYSLMTPSWAEAMEEAMAVLKGFDPEIVKRRRVVCVPAYRNSRSYPCRWNSATGQDPCRRLDKAEGWASQCSKARKPTSVIFKL